MKTVVLLCLCLGLLGCTSTPKVDIQAETDAIRNLEDQWTVALQTGDAEKIVSYFAPEAVSLRPNQPILVGLDAIRNRQVSMFADTTLLFNTYKGTIDIIEVSASGDLAYARGHDEITTKTKEGLVKDNGTWVDIWKKIDGQWKVTVSVGISDMPATGQ